MALAEAMACGLPAVAFDLPSGPARHLRDGIDGVLVPNGDMPAFAEALASLMKDCARRQATAARAPDVLDRFGVEQVMAIWDDLLGELTTTAMKLLFLHRFKDVEGVEREFGGAERQLVDLVCGLQSSGPRGHAGHLLPGRRHAGRCRTRRSPDRLARQVRPLGYPRLPVPPACEPFAASARTSSTAISGLPMPCSS